MLSGASFLSYQTAPLKSIRDAIQDDEHHIVRVNEEGTGTYNLNLSHSKPYASPVQKSIAAAAQQQEEQQQQQLDVEKGVGSSAGAAAAAATATKAGGSPRNGSGKSSPVASTGTPPSGIQSQSHHSRLGSFLPSRFSATDGANGRGEEAKYGANGSAESQVLQPQNGTLRGLKLPHIVGKRHAHGIVHTSNPSIRQEAEDASGQVSAPGTKDSEAFGTASPASLQRQPQADELPPSPPLEPDMNNYMPEDVAVKDTAQDEGKAATTDPSHEAESGKGRIKERTKQLERRLPRRATTDDPGSIRRPLARRDPSLASQASTSYLTASSHDGSEEDNNKNEESTVFVAEPTSYLHPSSAAHHDGVISPTGPAVRRASAASSLSYSGSPSRMPPRRNTTGASSGSHPSRKRHGSMGSQTSQRNLRASEGAPAAQNAQDEAPGVGAAMSRAQGVPVRTGDAGFDEVVAKQYDQIRRERESKKMREMQTGATDQEPQGQQGQQSHDAAHARTAGLSLQRARSRRGTEEDGPKAMIGNVIGEEHVNYVLMYNMLTGIRIGVSRCQAKMRRPLTDADYTAKHKFTFDIIGNELTPEAKYDFKFKDYAPWVFRELREHFHLDAADYLFSLTAKYILSELGSPGKSGSFFYFSRDYRFIIKTIRHNEHKFLRRILKDYHLHIKENPHTLLSRFYGLHRVKLPGGKKIHFVIMNNLFPPHKDIHETYDLKGSSVGREYPEEKAAQKKGAVLKDLNWIHRGRELELGPAKRALFEAQIRSDVALLQRLGIMDYSLLIGLHDMKRGNKEGLRQDALQVVQPDSNMPQTAAQTTLHSNLRREPTTRAEKEAFALRAAVRRSDAKALGSSSAARLPERETSDRHHLIFYQDEGGFRSTDAENRPSDWIYYFGIIDTLTLYNGTKRSEHYWKSITHNSRMISAVHPTPYGQRFCDFLFSLIKGADKSKRPRMK